VKLFAAAAFVLLLPHAIQAQSAPPESASPQDVTACDLIKDPRAYDGKEIRVRVIYVSLAEDSVFRSPDCCSGAKLSPWVDFSDDMDRISEHIRKHIDTGNTLALVTLTGVVEARAGGHVNGRILVDHLEKLEHTAKAYHLPDPAWVPDCDPRTPPPPQK
jgi:hypothetical protein